MCLLNMYVSNIIIFGYLDRSENLREKFIPTSSTLKHWIRSEKGDTRHHVTDSELLSLETWKPPQKKSMKIRFPRNSLQAHSHLSFFQAGEFRVQGHCFLGWLTTSELEIRQSGFDLLSPGRENLRQVGSSDFEMAADGSLIIRGAASNVPFSLRGFGFGCGFIPWIFFGFQMESPSD